MLFPWKYSGMFLGLLSSTFVSLATMLVSHLKGFHPYTKSSWRFLATVIPAIIIIVVYCVRKKGAGKILDNIWPPTNSKRFVNITFLLLRSFFGCTAVVLQYCSLKYMSLADSSTVAYSSPVFVSILAYFFLGEPFGLFSLFTTLLTLSGVVCITRPPFLTGETLNLDLIVGASLAFLCTIFRGIAIVIVRFLKDVHYSVVLFWFGSWGTVQSFILASYYNVLEIPTNEIDTLYTVGMGLLSCAGQICLVLALKAENAGPVALVRTCDVVFAFVWQMLFLQKMPDLFSLLGGLIILTGVLLAGFRKYVETLDESHKLRKFFWVVLK